MKTNLFTSGIKLTFTTFLIFIISLSFVPTAWADTFEECIAKGINAGVCAATDPENSCIAAGTDPAVCAAEISGAGSTSTAEVDNLSKQAAEKSKQASQGETNTKVKEIAESAELLHQLFAPMLNFLTFHIGNFLGTDYIFAADMGPMIKKIWVISRNLVNIFFVFILLGIALKEIFGGYLGMENKPIAKELIKITAFLILVNFSWLATKVVLDTANVATIASFAIPSGVSNTPENCEVDQIFGAENCVPSAKYTDAGSDEKVVLNYREDECADVKEAYEKAKLPTATKEDKLLVEGTTSVCWKSIDFFSYNQNNSVIYLTHGMARIQNLMGGNVSAGESFGKQITQLAVGTLFSLAIQAAYTVVLLALFIAMIIRMAMLWLFVGFSPVLIALAYWGGIDQGSSMHFSIKEFVRWSFIPAIIGVVFSVSFLMLAAGQSSGEALNKLNEMTTKAGDFEGIMYNLDTIFAGMETINDIIWLLMVLVILWMGVFAAFKDLYIVSTITDKIGDFGKRMGGYVANLPFAAPIIPITDSNGKSSRTSFRDVAHGMENKLAMREGYAADLVSMDKLNERAKDIASGRNDTRADQIEMMEAINRRDGKKLAQIFNNMSPKDVDSLSTNYLNELAITAGIEDSSQKRIFVESLKKYASEKESSTTSTDSPKPTGATAPAPTPDIGSALINQLNERAKEIASSKPAVKSEMMEAVNKGNGPKLAEIFNNMSSKDVKSLNQKQLDELAANAGIEDEALRGKFSDTLKEFGAKEE